MKSLSVINFIIFLSVNFSSADSINAHINRNNSSSELFRDESLPLDERVEDLLGRLTLEEKCLLTSGGFYSGGIPRFNIPQLAVADGPVGIRLQKHDPRMKKAQPDRTTALPATLLLAATWNRQSAHAYSSVIADEMLAVGKHVLLGPGINIMRDPRGGRNYEYFGEDPYLTAEMAIEYVRGLQDKRIGADLKHYVCNESDTKRHYASSNIDRRTLREIYAYPFERAIQEAGVWSVMAGNNLVNGTHVAENKDMLKSILREQIGFDGVILTDWRAVYQAKPAVLATLDMTTGYCGYVYGDGSLLELFKSGELSQSMLDEMARRILTLYFRAGVINPLLLSPGSIDTPEHRATARDIAAEGMVLLKNSHELLPIKNADRIIITGSSATSAIMGGGSGRVNNGIGNRSPFDGLEDCYGVEHVQLIKDSTAITADTLKNTDLLVFCANTPQAGENSDLKDIQLMDGQVSEIVRLAELTDRLLVVLQTGSTADMTQWNDAADAILVAWYAGQSSGDAIADIIRGKVNPAGRLPCTFGNSIADYPCARLGTWPPKLILDKDPGPNGYKKTDRKQIYAYASDYKEGTLIGHQWFDAKQITPLYPFGYGLSYTEFKLSGLEIVDTATGWDVFCEVKNSGKVAGAEVVQLYVCDPDASVPRPYRILRGFNKIFLKPGESTRVKISLKTNDLAFFDDKAGKWRAEAGAFLIYVGSSSLDLPLEGQIQLPRDFLLDHP